MHEASNPTPEEIIDVGRGVTLCCDRFGDPADPPMLLIMGLGQPLLAWPVELCQALADRGFHVIRFDNRDSGRSWHARQAPPRMGQLIARRFGRDQYNLEHMAQDTTGLIDGLGLRPVHVVGVSMGAMIAQTLAAHHPDHIRSLVSVMSTTGARRTGWVAPSTLRLLFRHPARTREEAAERAVTMFRHIGSPGFPLDEQSVRKRAMAAFDRDPRAAAGKGRQMAAILKSGDRTAELRRITAPTLVIHGDHDRMVHGSGGRATAAAIPGARLEIIKGMGHDLPAALFPRLVDLFVDHASAADRARGVRAPAGR